MQVIIREIMHFVVLHVLSKVLLYSPPPTLAFWNFPALAVIRIPLLVAPQE